MPPHTRGLTSGMDRNCYQSVHVNAITVWPEFNKRSPMDGPAGPKCCLVVLNCAIIIILLHIILLTGSPWPGALVLHPERLFVIIIETKDMLHDKALMPSHRVAMHGFIATVCTVVVFDILQLRTTKLKWKMKQNKKCGKESSPRQRCHRKSLSILYCSFEAPKLRKYQTLQLFSLHPVIMPQAHAVKCQRSTWILSRKIFCFAFLFFLVSLSFYYFRQQTTRLSANVDCIELSIRNIELKDNWFAYTHTDNTHPSTLVTRLHHHTYKSGFCCWPGCSAPHHADERRLTL